MRRLIGLRVLFWPHLDHPAVICDGLEHAVEVAATSVYEAAVPALGRVPPLTPVRPESKRIVRKLIEGDEEAMLPKNEQLSSGVLR